MKKIYSNGVNVELAYHETKAKFGNKEFTTKRHLVLSVLEKDGRKYIPITRYFDLDDERDIYGEIYDGGEHLSLFRTFDELLPDIKSTDVFAMLEAIRKFTIKLTNDFDNKVFAEKLNDVIWYRADEE